MSSEPTLLDLASAGPIQAETDACDIAMLQELADITMDLSRAMGRLALEKAAEGDAEAAGKLTVVVTRVGRAMRQTIAYRRKIEDQLRETGNKRTAEQEQAEAQQAANEACYGRIRSAGRKKMIERAVGRLLNDIEDEEEHEELSKELKERLGDYERLVDFSDRPVSEFVAKISKALGLDIDWSRFEHDAWAVKEAETKAENSPFAAWWASTHPDPANDPPDIGAAAGTGPPLAAE